MTRELLLLNIVFVPVLGAFLLPSLERISKRFRDLSALTFVGISFVFTLCLAPGVLAGKTVVIAKYLPLGFNLILRADGLAVFMAAVSSFISALIVLYSFGYISHYENQNEYYFLVVLFLGSMMGLVFSANLIFLYLFWELTAITSWRLIGFFREKNHVIRADKSFLVTVFGALVMLLGFIGLYQQTGSFDLTVIRETLKTNPVSDLTVLLILIGILSKSATLPFHTWLPDAGVAPSPVTALLHAAVLVKIGVYVFARLFIATFALNEFWHGTMALIAAASVIVAAGAALIETDLKRIIAYSTVSQIGFIFFGFALGTEIGIAGALLFILTHGLAKAGLFLCAGVVEQNSKNRDITRLGGLIKTMPVTALTFLICAFAIMGIPPLGGFFSKYMVFMGALQGGYVGLALIFLGGAFLTILYLFRAFNAVFLGEMKTPVAQEGSKIMLLTLIVFAALSVAVGVFIPYFSGIVRTVTQQMLGIIR